MLSANVISCLAKLLFLGSVEIKVNLSQLAVLTEFYYGLHVHCQGVFSKYPIADFSFTTVCSYRRCERATPTSANSTLQTRIAAPLPS